MTGLGGSRGLAAATHREARCVRDDRLAGVGVRQGKTAKLVHLDVVADDGVEISFPKFGVIPLEFFDVLLCQFPAFRFCHVLSDDDSRNHAVILSQFPGNNTNIKEVVHYNFLISDGNKELDAPHRPVVTDL